MWVSVEEFPEVGYRGGSCGFSWVALDLELSEASLANKK